jgi:proton-translocating NADH-quinone oxidoreductase chain N
MSAVLFIALPLLFGFSIPLLSRFGKNTIAYTSTLMQLFLLYLSVSLLLSDTLHVEVIAIAPPLGISLVLNKASLFFVTLFTLLITLFSLFYLSYSKEKPYKNESKFFILINMLLASSIGLVLSSDIFNIYVFFEIAGISAYILSAYKKTPSALEAGLKYLLTGAVASVFLIFAITLIYLHLGTLNLAQISQGFGALHYNIKFLISLLLLIGFGFKVEIFPLNFWVSDIYEGSSSLVNALFSSIVVKAYLFVFFHILYLLMPYGEFSLFLVYLGAVSMLIAEIVALRQSNLKRIFAYSSLGQVGLLFSAFALGDEDAITAALFIVLAHSVAKIFIFLALSDMFKKYKTTDITLLRKLNSPFLKFGLLIAMLSLLGLPPLAGFIGKFLLLKSFAQSSLYLAIFIILAASMIESIYYFKIAGMLFVKGERDLKSLHVSFGKKFSLGIALLILIIVGIAPFSISSYLYEASQTMLDSQVYIEQILGKSL